MLYEVITYRIDIYQTIYFVLDTFDHLFELAQADWMKFKINYLPC